MAKAAKMPMKPAGMPMKMGNGMAGSTGGSTVQPTSPVPVVRVSTKIVPPTSGKAAKKR